MAKPENDKSFPEKQTWRTWEELLLACAVHRHGTDSWTSVSAEIHKRSLNLRHITASACRLKYSDLKRRFTRESVSEISTVHWLDELRKSRVDELRREVEQFDLSISSLQTKVKKLEEEREISLNEPETLIENSDLNIFVDFRESDGDCGEPAPNPSNHSVNDPDSPDPKDNSPGTASENGKRYEETTENDDYGGDRKLYGENSGDCGETAPNPSIHSVNDSDSPDLKDISPGTALENGKRYEETTGIDDYGGEGKLSGEESGKGSSESVKKDSAAKSMAGLERGEEEEEEEEEGKETTSDVQSTASLPRKETSYQSLSAVDIFVGESEPLIRFVEILLSHPCGSHFSRQLESQIQETQDYTNIIREHIDFETILKRVEEGYYKTSTKMLFRDLLLLINNAKVFYHNKRSFSEFKSAEELHELVKRHMMTSLEKTQPKEKFLDSLQETVITVSSKPRMFVPNPIVACRKRSSLCSKPLLVVNDDKKLISETCEQDDESWILKKMNRGRSSSSAKTVAIKNNDSILNVGNKKADVDKKGNKTNSLKKKGVASFLQRIKVCETLSKPSSVSDSSASGEGRGEQRKSNSNKDDAKKIQTNEKGSPLKKKSMKREANPSSSSSSPTRLKKRVR